MFATLLIMGVSRAFLGAVSNCEDLLNAFSWVPLFATVNNVSSKAAQNCAKRGIGPCFRFFLCPKSNLHLDLTVYRSDERMALRVQRCNGTVGRPRPDPKSPSWKESK